MFDRWMEQRAYVDHVVDALSEGAKAGDKGCTWLLEQTKAELAAVSKRAIRRWLLTSESIFPERVRVIAAPGAVSRRRGGTVSSHAISRCLWFIGLF